MNEYSLAVLLQQTATTNKPVLLLFIIIENEWSLCKPFDGNTNVT